MNGVDPPDLVYLDHAATSWPPRPEVVSAMVDFLDRCSSAGRSGHRLARAAEEVTWGARVALALLLGARPETFAFAQNATMAINEAMVSAVRPGAPVVVSEIEHNSIIRAARRWAEGPVEVCPCGDDGTIDLDALQGVLRTSNPCLIAVTHASNVTGALNPIEAIGALTAAHDVPLLVDAAQTVGKVPIDLSALPGVHYLAFPGHKGLHGPQGTGALYVAPGAVFRPMLAGGTGTHSESLDQPSLLPDGAEAGTRNGVGIAGLGAAVAALKAHGVDEVRATDQRLCETLRQGLAEVPGAVLVPAASSGSVGIVSFAVRGFLSTEVVHLLDREFGVLARGGLHCAPLAHRRLGTMPDGLVRLSTGWGTGDDEVAAAMNAVAEIADRAPVCNRGGPGA